MPVGDVLPEIALVVAAVVTLLVAAFVPRQANRWCAVLSLAGLAAAAGLAAVASRGTSRLTFNDTWALDGATHAARLIILAFAAASVGLAPDWMSGDRRHGEFYAILLLSAAGAMLMAGAADTMELVMGVLLSSVTGFTLAAYHRAWPLSVEAGAKYFLIGALASALLVAGVVLLFGLAGDTSYRATAAALAVRLSAGRNATWGVLVAVSFVTVGLAYKLAAFPAHTWLPDVAEGSPLPAAAFLSVAPKLGALVALARVTEMVPQGSVPWRPLVAVLAAVTMTVGNLGALWQTDIRRLLGWSSVSQSGYALVAVAALGGSRLAVPGLLFFVAAYGAANLAAFGAVAHLRGRTDLASYRGLGRARPWTAAALVISLLSLVGVPPLAGFFGKVLVFGAAIDAGYAWLAVVAVANTVASLFYYLRVIAPVYLDEPADESVAVAVLGGWSGWTLAVAVAATVALGLGAQAVWSALRGASLLL